MVEIVDGVFNIIALFFFKGCLIISLMEYSKKKDVGSLTLLLLFIGGSLFVIGNILEKFELIDIKVADDISETFKIFCAIMVFFWGFIPIMEEKIKESELKYKNAYNRLNFYKDLFAHDMNNIFQSMLISFELYKIYQEQPNKNNKLDELMKIFKDQIDRAICLIHNVQKLSNIENGKFSLHEIEVLQVLNNAISYIENNFSDKNLKIKVITNETNCYIQGNELLLDVFENLLINAVKHNPNPVIEITIQVDRIKEKDKEFLRLQFIDNAQGISDTRKKGIFKRTFAHDKSVGGMGLGLSLVKEIIDSYHGKIFVKDRIEGDYEKGSNFIMQIPIISHEGS
ncbi:MAG: sensor histidine kinase [Promethearchaeota archaeon]